MDRLTLDDFRRQPKLANADDRNKRQGPPLQSEPVRTPTLRRRRRGKVDLGFAGSPARSERLLLAIILGLTLLLGGSGSSWPGLAALVQFGALVLIAHRLWRGTSGSVPSIPAFAALLVVSILLVPLLQMVPLPPSLWAGLPGRAEAAEILSAAGLAAEWRPLSLDPAATVTATLTLLPGLAFFLLIPAVKPEDRTPMLLVLVGAAALSALLGALQRASGGAAAPFADVHAAFGPGLFVNRNHQASFLQIGMLMSACAPAWLGKRRLPQAQAIAGALIALMAAASIATTSRMGLITLPFALALALLLLFRPRIGRRLTIGAILFATVMAAAMAFLPAIEIILDRFSGSRDIRFDFWPDAWAGMLHFWPVGAGLGTFPILSEIFESLDLVAPQRTINAHNDYLELLFEAGAAAALLLILFGSWLVLNAFHLRKLKRSDDLTPVAAMGGIVVILIHSVSDYPLRMEALMAVFGILCALAMKRGPSRVAPTPTGVELRLRKGATLLALLPIFAVIIIAALAQQASDRGDHKTASALMPAYVPSAVGSATLALEEERPQAAAAQAHFAVRQAPLNPAAVSTLAMARSALGQNAQAQTLMSLSASLGWRDIPAQLWMLDLALQQGEAQAAVLRADALLRQGRADRDRLMAALREVTLAPGGADAVAGRLAMRPNWRTAFLRRVSALEERHWPPFAEILQLLARSDAPPEEEEIGPFLDHLLKNGQAVAAFQIWSRLNGITDDSAPIRDGGFEEARVGKAALPFQWRVEAPRGAIVSLERLPGQDHRSVHITSFATVAGPVLRQILLLDPGSWTMTFRAIGDPSAMDSVRWEIRCLPGPALRTAALAPEGAGASRAHGLRFAVPEGCRAQQLTLHLGHGSSQPLDLWIDDVTLRKND